MTTLKKIAKSSAILLLTVLLSVSFRTFLYEPFHIPSMSMRTSLLEGDYIFVAKYAYGFSKYSFPFNAPLISGKILSKNPERGNMVVFRPKKNPEMHFVKRVVGLPGDLIRVTNGVLFINDVPVKNEFLSEYTDNGSNALSFRNSKKFIETLPNGKTYEIIKNNSESTLNNTITYKVPNDEFFVMGDNRDNSRDSRFYDIGFIHKERIVGKPKLIVFSIDKEKPWYKSIRLERFLHKL